jgi:hypothetical protein
MHIMRTFMSLIKDGGTGEYIEHLTACLAAPTINGLKPGSLINIRRQGDDKIAATWNAQKTSLTRKLGVEALDLSPGVNHGKRDGSSALILIYRREFLARTLAAKEAMEILAASGYDTKGANVDSLLSRLAERFERGCPHEIGLFLGYPPEDVRGFMRDGGDGSIATGYWKVYGNVTEARRAFQKFRRAEYDAAKAIIALSSADMTRAAYPVPA